jgi:hypothetical protein
MSNWWRWAGATVSVVAVLASAGPVQAQKRDLSRPRRLRPRVEQPATAARPQAPYRGPWTAARSSFVLSAESLFGIGYARQVEQLTDTFGQRREIVSSGLVLHVFKGSELDAPLSTARLGFDGVLGPGVTLGAGFGFNQFDQEITTGNETTSLTIRTLIFAPRVGYLLAPSRYVGVWLRGGIAYINMHLEIADVRQKISATALTLDPMLVITPLPHVGIFVGPSLNVGLGGGATATDENGISVGDEDVKYSYYGVTSGIGLLF